MQGPIWMFQSMFITLMLVSITESKTDSNQGGDLADQIKALKIALDAEIEARKQLAEEFAAYKKKLENPYGINA